jgi:hypothetical protein
VGLYGRAENARGKTAVLKLSLETSHSQRHEDVRETDVQLNHSEPRRDMETKGQLAVSAALPPEKEASVPTGQETGWAPEPVWTSLFLLEIEPRFLGLVHNLVTDSLILAYRHYVTGVSERQQAPGK